MRDQVCKIELTLNELGYKFFDDIQPYNVNIIGERTTNEHTNKFDDFLHLVYRDHNLNWQYHKWLITTQPGTYYLKNPINAYGTAILVPGQYNGVFGIGKHQGKYDALCQMHGPVKVYRDNDRDNEYDLDPDSIHSGWFGINIHRSNPYSESHLIDKWSAGCQVFKRIKDFKLFMKVLKISKGLFGNKFTYTLVLSEDLGHH